jgi:hypothetical protein
LKNYLAKIEEDRTNTLGQVNALFGKAQQAYQPGGAMEKATEAMLNRGSMKANASYNADLASRGFGTSTMVGGGARKFNEEVGVPTRLASEANRSSALANLLTQQASATGNLSMPGSGELGLVDMIAQIYARPNPSSGGMGGFSTPSINTTGYRPSAAQTVAQPTAASPSRPSSTPVSLPAINTRAVVDPNMISGLATRGGATQAFLESGKLVDLPTGSSYKVGDIYGK